MSFLNSVLSSIGGDATAPSSNVANVTKTKPSTSVTIPTHLKAGLPTTSGIKRSSQGDHPAQPPSKTMRIELQNTTSAFKDVSLRPISGMQSVSKSTGLTVTKTPLRIDPYSTPSRPLGTKSVPAQNTTQPASVPGRIGSTNTTSVAKSLPHRAPLTASKPAAPTVNPTSRPAVLSRPGSSVASAPTTAKKGSYREIMERAQAAKATQASLGQITHKAVPKISKKEKLAQEAEAAQKSKEAARGKSSAVVGVKSEKLPASGQLANKGPPSTKEKKPPADLGYKGTMRPNSSEPTYKGTAKPVTSSASASQRNNIPKRPPEGRSGGQDRYRYADYSDEEEEEDYMSGSEDMEVAGFGELDEEEELSLRQARQDDAREKKLEDTLKQQKRQRLEALAAATAAKRARH